MKCRHCKSELEPRDGAYRCCGVVTRLTDPGYIPSPGFVPSPYRVPAPSPFKPLESELGWAQPIEDVVLEEETPREKAQRERRERECVSSVERAHVNALKEETRRVNAATALRGAAYLRNRLRLDAMRGAA